MQRKSHSVDAYFGAPDWWHSLLRQDLSSNVYTLNIRSVGPWGIRYDYMLNRRVGIGADIWYVATSFSGGYKQAGTATTPSTNVSFSGKLTRINGIAKMTLHLSNHEKLDPYVHFGLGYLYSNLNFQSTNKAIYNETDPLPILAFRLGMGVKYYFSPDFGAVLDVGFGGPLVSIGLFTRWRKAWDQ